MVHELKIECSQHTEHQHHSMQTVTTKTYMQRLVFYDIHSESAIIVRNKDEGILIASYCSLVVYS